MRKARTPLLLTALVMILGSVAFAANGIEVLNVAQMGEGYLVDSITHGVPPGSHMEAVTYIDGCPIVVDCAPIAPGCGHSVVFFPEARESNTMIARGPGGEVLFGENIIETQGLLEAD